MKDFIITIEKFDYGLYTRQYYYINNTFLKKANDPWSQKVYAKECHDICHLPSHSSEKKKCVQREKVMLQNIKNL